MRYKLDVCVCVCVCCVCVCVMCVRVCVLCVCVCTSGDDGLLVHVIDTTVYKLGVRALRHHYPVRYALCM